MERWRIFKEAIFSLIISPYILAPFHKCAIANKKIEDEDRLDRKIVTGPQLSYHLENQEATFHIISPWLNFLQNASYPL